MPSLLPSSSTCYALKLPQLDDHSAATLDETAKRKLTLECRTGAAVVLARSSVFVHGGLTVPLNFSSISSSQLQQELILHFAREKKSTISFNNLSEWISTETFFLDLISRKWERVETSLGKSSIPNITSVLENPMRERLFHTMSFAGSCLYVFGGLMVSPQSGYELIASNELWKLDLSTKTWTLISSDPSITRRFNHEAHILYGRNDDKDTRLVVTGGLNNMDKPIHSIDVYNLDKGTWESGSNTFGSPIKGMVTNIDGSAISLTRENNFSLLLEKSPDQTPSLIFYSPSNNLDTISENPIVAIPLESQTKGLRMSIYKDSGVLENRLKIPFHLQYPSGAHFGSNIIIFGFYPNSQTSNFHCFVYNIPSGKWSKISTTCDDTDLVRHRFWKLFIWESHHKAVILGSKLNDHCLPSVQKFDYLLCVGLPMLNLFHSTTFKPESDIPIPQSDSKSKTDHFESYSRYIAPPSELTSVTSVFPSYAMVLGKDALEVYGNLLSDFEIISEEGDSIGVPSFLLRKRWGRYFDMLIAQSYSRVCLEYESNSPHNDLLKSSSSNQSNSLGFVTKEGPTSSSQGSLEVFFNKHKGSTQSTASNVGKKSSSLLFSNRSNATSAAGPTSTLRGNDEDQSTESNNSNTGSSSYFPPTIESRAIASHSTGDLPKSSPLSSQTTSSSGGMFFRLPFQDGYENGSKNASANSHSPLASSLPPMDLDHGRDSEPHSFGKYNPSGLSALPISSTDRTASIHPTSSTIDTIRPSNRRASHPVSSGNNSGLNGHLSALNNLRYMPSPYSSRKASITSQTSSISYVSSSSDRMGNSIHPQHSGGSTGGLHAPIGSLNIQLPPQPKMPTEPLPSVPHQVPCDVSYSRRRSSDHSMAGFLRSAKNSPLSSRRSSLYHDASNHASLGSELPSFKLSLSRKGSVDQQPADDSFPAPMESGNLPTRSLDKQMLEDNSIDLEASTGSLNKSQSAKNNQPSSENSFAKTFVSSDGTRPSWAPTLDSSTSASSNVINELEPLLSPRSLYMPVPTSTLKALSEFFYTGQVNGKWLLSPVAIDLFIAAKYFEIPLLYDLMSEVLYSIIGKKEESFFVACASLKQLFTNKVSKYCNGDDAKIEDYLANHKNYLEFLKLENSLKNIDDGYFDISLMRKASTAMSVSTEGSKGNGSVDKATATEFDFSSTVNDPLLFNSAFRDNQIPSTPTGLTAFLSSAGSKKTGSGYSESFNKRKKSSLSNEVHLSINENPWEEARGKDGEAPFQTAFTMSDTIPEKQEKEGVQSNKSEDWSKNYKNGYEGEVDEDDEDEDEDGSDENGIREDYDEQEKLRFLSQDDQSDEEGKIIDARLSADENAAIETEANDENLNELIAGSNKQRNGSSSSSDSADLGVGIGLLSLSKFERKVREGDVEEPVDPLTKVSGDFGHIPNKHNTSGNKASKTHNLPTLETLASPDSLPPVDYVIELLYETAVLTCDIKLMVRTMDCIQLSKALKSLKRKLSHDIVLLDEELKRTEKPLGVVERKPRMAKSRKPKLESSFSEVLSPIPSFERISRSLSNLNLQKNVSRSVTPDLGKKNKPTPASDQLSPKRASSVLDETAQPASAPHKTSQGKPTKTKKAEAHYSSSGLTGAGIFLGGPFMTAPPSSSSGKRKKDSTTGSSAGGTNFPFFGRKK